MLESRKLARGALKAVIEESKKYEYLATSADPAFDAQVRATAIVKRFIRERSLIVYGGTAIDYALRLHGDKIYPDEMQSVPDLDFYSPRNVEDAYDLADALYLAGFENTRVINATHTGTMRVDIGDNHWMADISWVPPNAFSVIPTIEYEGVRVVHPMFQRMDVHSSLAYPYDDPPREVVFARWSKDVKRFNILDKYYPVTPPEPKLRSARDVARPRIPDDMVRTGLSAYPLLYQWALDALRGAGREMPKEVLAPTSIMAHFGGLMEIVHMHPTKAIARIFAANGVQVDSKYTASTARTTGDIVSHETTEDVLEGLVKGISTQITEREPYMSIIAHHYEVVGGGHPNHHFIVYDTAHELVGYNTIRAIEDGESHRYRVTNIQWNLKHFLAMSYRATKSADANVYLGLYCSLLAMIRAYENAGLPAEGPLFPSVVTYGSDNIGIAMEVALNRAQHDLDGTPLYKMPLHYTPARMIPKGLPHPPFDPDAIPFFRTGGRDVRVVRGSG